MDRKYRLISIFKKRKFLLGVSFLILLAAAGVAIAAAVNSGKNAVKIKSPIKAEKDQTTGVLLYTVKRETMDVYIIAKGTIEAVRSIRIKAPGIRKWWQYRLTKLVPAGKIVQQGTVLAEFDTDEIDKYIKDVEEQVDELKKKELTMLEEQKLNLQDYQDRVDQTKRAISDATESNLLKIKELKEQLEDAKFTFNEKKRQQGIALKEIDDQISAAKRAHELKKLSSLNLKYAAEVEKKKMLLQLQESEENIRIVERKKNIALGNHQIELKKYQAGIARAESNLKTHNIFWETRLNDLNKNHKKAIRNLTSRKTFLAAQIKRHRDHIKKKEDAITLFKKHKTQYVIRAPVRGLVLHRTFWHDGGHAPPEVGDTIRRSYNFMELPFLERMKSVVKINEIDIVQLKNRLKVEITLPSYKDLSFKGYIEKIDNVATQQRHETIKTFKIEIFFDKSDVRIQPGMSSINKITIAEYPNVVFVPLSSVYYEDKKKFLFRKRGPKFEQVEITTGANNLDFVIVTQGLNPGDQVAIEKPPANLISQ